MVNLIETLIGDLSEKKKYRETEKRAKALPAEYTQAYADIKHYLWNTSGILGIDPLVSLVDLLEEAASDGKKVTDITGPDVAAFADELARDEASYKDRQKEKLNAKFAKKNK